MLPKLSSGQGCPSKKCIFGHVTSLIGENVIAAYSEKFSQGYCIHLPNMKRIRLTAAELLQKEMWIQRNLAESLLLYTNKRPLRDA